MRHLLVLSFIASISLALSFGARAVLTVHLSNTVLSGSNLPLLGQEFFGGIPYASPPIGELRFRAPVPKRSLGVQNFNATEFGPGCLQSPMSSSAVQNSSEDGLTINIFRPAGLTEQDRLPVMVWVFGGGFPALGSIYNPSGIVSQSISRGTPAIWVNFNYRLGPLGFPVRSEAADTGLLNLGLRDQLTAFQWVQDNIGKFGDDHHKVTVFGESAGAISIGIHFLNPEFKNFARAAIFESGSAATKPPFPASHGQPVWDNFLHAVPDCKSRLGSPFNCLCTVNSSVLLNTVEVSTAQSKQPYPWAPAIDGPGGILPDLPSKLFAAGQFARLPFIAGMNLDEGTMFTSISTNSSQMVKTSIILNYSLSSTPDIHLAEAVDRLLELYPDIPSLGSPFSTGDDTFGLDSKFKRLAAITGDLWFQSQRRTWSQVASKAGVKMFAYLFTDPAPPAFLPYFGVLHSLDVYYVYGWLSAVGGSVPAMCLGGQMMDYWISFAASLDPNDGMGSVRPNWPEYKDGLLQLNSANMTVIPDDYRSEEINFINENLVLFRH
ncbi:extracellular triacylglycerol lipase precursor [Mycena leptocephala]|nr:extracellular triacylglycerol lipase precursor [Mycena leptocephala]